MTVIDTMIRSWKKARKACDNGLLDYPGINILHPEHGVSSDGDIPESPDADFVQSVVEKMPGEIRSTFEAFHLGIIRGEYCRDKPHKWRRLVLGISKNIYDYRELAGRTIIRNYVLTSPSFKAK